MKKIIVLICVVNVYLIAHCQQDSIKKLEHEASLASFININKAIRLYTKLISINPYNKNYFFFRSLCDIDFNKYDSAFIDADMALKNGYDTIKIFSLMSFTYSVHSGQSFQITADTFLVSNNIVKIV